MRIEHVYLPELDLDLAHRILSQRATLLELLRKLHPQIKALPEQSALRGYLDQLQSSVPIVTMMERKDPYRSWPLYCFYLRSRFDPTWRALAGSVITNAWSNYIKNNGLTVEALCSIKLSGGSWDSSDVRESMDRFRRLRKANGWKRAVVGGVFMLEVCRSHHNLHCHLILNKGFKAGSVTRYATWLWKMGQEIAPNQVLLNTPSHAIAHTSFDDSISLCVLKDLRNIEAGTLLKVIDQLKDLQLVYRFGALSSVPELNIKL